MSKDRRWTCQLKQREPILLSLLLCSIQDLSRLDDAYPSDKNGLLYFLC